MYANRQRKEAITLIAEMVGTGGSWVPEKMFDGARKEFKTALTMLNKVLDHLCKDLDADQRDSLIRFCENNTLQFAPSSPHGLAEEFYTVAASDMAYLIDQCAIECTGCTKSGREVKQCQMRRIMLRSGVLPSGEKECPFSTGI